MTEKKFKRYLAMAISAIVLITTQFLGFPALAAGDDRNVSVAAFNDSRITLKSAHGEPDTEPKQLIMADIAGIYDIFSTDTFVGHTPETLGIMTIGGDGDFSFLVEQDRLHCQGQATIENKVIQSLVTCKYIELPVFIEKNIEIDLTGITEFDLFQASTSHSMYNDKGELINETTDVMEFKRQQPTVADIAGTYKVFLTNTFVGHMTIGEDGNFSFHNEGLHCQGQATIKNSVIQSPVTCKFTGLPVFIEKSIEIDLTGITEFDLFQASTSHIMYDNKEKLISKTTDVMEFKRQQP